MYPEMEIFIESIWKTLFLHVARINLTVNLQGHDHEQEKYVHIELYKTAPASTQLRTLNSQDYAGT